MATGRVFPACSNFRRLRIPALVITWLLLITEKVSSEVAGEGGGTEYVVIGPKFNYKNCYKNQPNEFPPYMSLRPLSTNIDSNTKWMLRGYCDLHIKLKSHVKNKRAMGEYVEYNNYWPFMLTDGQGLEGLGCSDNMNNNNLNKFYYNACRRMVHIYGSIDTNTYLNMTYNSLADLTYYTNLDITDSRLLVNQSEREKILNEDIGYNIKTNDDDKDSCKRINVTNNTSKFSQDANFASKFSHFPRFKKYSYKNKVVIPITNIGYGEIRKYHQETFDVFVNGYPCTKLQGTRHWRDIINFNNNSDLPLDQKVDPFPGGLGGLVYAPAETNNTAVDNMKVRLSLDPYTKEPCTNIRLSNIDIVTSYLSLREVIEGAFRDTNAIIIPLQFGCSSEMCTGLKPKREYTTVQSNSVLGKAISAFPITTTDGDEKQPGMLQLTPFEAVFGFVPPLDSKSASNMIKKGTYPLGTSLSEIYGYTSVIDKAIKSNKLIQPICIEPTKPAAPDLPGDHVSLIVDSIIDGLLKRSKDLKLLASKGKSGDATGTDIVPKKSEPSYEYVKDPYYTRSILTSLAENVDLPVDALGASIFTKRSYAQDTTLFEGSHYLAEFLTRIVKHFYNVLESIALKYNGLPTADEQSIDGILPEKVYYRHAPVIPTGALLNMNIYLPYTGRWNCRSFAVVLSAKLVKARLSAYRSLKYQFVPEVNYVELPCKSAKGFYFGEILTRCAMPYKESDKWGVVTNLRKVAYVHAYNLNSKIIDKLDNLISNETASITPFDTDVADVLPDGLSESNCEFLFVSKDAVKKSIEKYYGGGSPTTVPNFLMMDRRSERIIRLYRMSANSIRSKHSFDYDSLGFHTNM